MIHSTAIIEPGAQLGRNVAVGPYAYIGPRVVLGDDCQVQRAASIVGRTTVGNGCVFFTHSVIGEVPQDLKFKGEDTETRIGEDNHFREFVTVHAGTAVGGGVTHIGNHNRILVGVHLAHDTHVGNHVIITNNVQIAGHVFIEDCVTIGGQTAIHHFVTVGRYAMLGGLSRVAQDAPPFMITTGYPAEVRGLNSEGLKRWNLAPEDIQALSRAFKTLYARRRATPFSERLAGLDAEEHQNVQVQYLCEFVKRTQSAGNRGRYRELLRRDTAADRMAFFKKKRDGTH